MCFSVYVCMWLCGCVGVCIWEGVHERVRAYVFERVSKYLCIYRCMSYACVRVRMSVRAPHRYGVNCD